MGFSVRDDEDSTMNDLPNTDVPSEVHTIQMSESIPDRSIVEESLPLEDMEINNLSPLK